MRGEGGKNECYRKRITLNAPVKYDNIYVNGRKLPDRRFQSAASGGFCIIKRQLCNKKRVFANYWKYYLGTGSKIPDKRADE
jgi:hypothetical protein